jgi:ATP-dependent helicase/nuclease subunit A
VLAQGLRVPDDLPGGRMSAAVLTATPGAIPFTDEQRAAIEDRDGSALLAANAGSGKTAVMAERCVEAVLQDGVPVGSILALTFTEKAAGELRDRIRRRFLALGKEEHAREVDAGWIGTIHGFCARVLRSRPLAAGLDPRFEVLDEGAAERLARDAYDRAFEDWAAARGAAAVDVAAAFGAGLRELVLAAHSTLRSRGQTRPVLPVPPPAPDPDPAELAAARAEAARCLATGASVSGDEASARGRGKKLEEALDALESCDRALGEPGVPVPAALAPGELKKGSKALEQAPCAGYRAAWTAYRQGCADHHARLALVEIADLLTRFGAAYAEAKAARAGLDFEDLELGVRDLLAADPADRERWAERFRLVMVDEFQDTNRLQLDILEALERDNLFAVGDEFQSIYGFRHADVTIFRERRAALGEERSRLLTANFRSREELLDVLNGAFAPQWVERFAPLLAGGTASDSGELRLFDPGEPGDTEPRVELVVTDSRGWEGDDRLGLNGVEAKPHRRAEARVIAHRLRQELEAGRAARDIVVLVRATASLRLFEEALEEQGVPTYVVGGRGYWSQQPVRDGLAYLAALANPLDEEALYGTLASPFCGVGSDALILLSQGEGVWATLRGGVPPEVPAEDAERLRRFAAFFAAERAHAERLPVEVLLERALEATGYDLAVLARAGGERRLANLRKLMRLAREYERAEGRDIRGFLAYAATRDLAAAREGEAPLESEGLDAVRLMTIHRAKGLEFPVVCVADLGRQGGGRTERLLLGADGAVGLRLSTPGGGATVPALAFERLAAETAAHEDAEERRLFYVAMTRACDRLILSGTADPEKPGQPRPGGPPIDWILPAIIGVAPQTDRIVHGSFDGRPTRTLARVVTPATIAPDALVERAREGSPGTALPARAKVVPAPSAGRPAPQRLSYTALGQYAKCPYRFYLERTLRLPPVEPPSPLETSSAGGLDPRVRGVIAHRLLEDLEFARPLAPEPATVHLLAAEEDAELSPEDVADIRQIVVAFGASPLCARIAAATTVRREAGFSFALDPAQGALVNGFVDVLAKTPDGTMLVVDYKSDRIGEEHPQQVVERDYATQRIVYALAALRNGAPAVEVAYAFLERPDAPVTATFTPKDIPALAEQLTNLAEGVLEGRHPVAATPHRALCGDCPGRKTLCSHPEELTLRELPA